MAGITEKRLENKHIYVLLIIYPPREHTKECTVDTGKMVETKYLKKINIK